MIFSVADHVEQIVKGLKTQTRRDSDRYKVGKTYAIQPSRTAKADPRGRIFIHDKWSEKKTYLGGYCFIHKLDAMAEGGYKVDEYEELYEEMHPRWKTRWAYQFEFIPVEEGSE